MGSLWLAKHCSVCFRPAWHGNSDSTNGLS